MSADERRGRKGRGRGEEVPREELGWIEDLRQAREQGGDLGPGTDDEPVPPPSRTGRRGLLGGRMFGGTDQPDESGGSWRERRDARRADDLQRADDPRFAGLRGDEPPRGSEPRSSEPRGSEPRLSEPRGSEPRLSEPRRAEPRTSDLPAESRRESTRERLGSRFASLRGMRGTERRPDVPAPALTPLPPDVVSPRGVPPVPDRPVDRTRRDPDQPGRHETVPPPPARGRGSATPPAPPAPAPGRAAPPGRTPAGPGTGRTARPAPPPLGRPGEPSWHDLATGEKTPVRTTGEQPPVRRTTGEQPPVRRTTGEQPPVRRGTGDLPPVRRGTGEQPPVRRGTGDLPPVRRGTGEQPPVRRGTGEVPPVRRGTGEQAPVRRPTGEQTAVPGQRPPWRRTQLRQQVREARRFRLVILAAVAVVLLAALPAIFLIRDAAGDPVFAGLDGLTLPGWARQSHVDLASGNRWCIKTCMLRERTWRAVKPPKDTDPVYQQALLDAGWHPRHTAGCPTAPGVYTCWQRDEYLLDLWTRDAPCDLAGVAPAPGTSQSPVNPSAGPVPTPTGSGPPPTCGGSLVTAKVATWGDSNWHQ